MRRRMRVRKAIRFLVLASLLGMCSCGEPSAKVETETLTAADAAVDAAVESQEEQPLNYECSLALQYAENFTVDYYEGG